METPRLLRARLALAPPRPSHARNLRQPPPAVNCAAGLGGLAIVPGAFGSAVYGPIGIILGKNMLGGVGDMAAHAWMEELAIYCTGLLGAATGFLWFNGYPAQVIMGDTGSLSLGGTLAALAVLTKQELLFLIVGAIFVYEALSVLIQEQIGILRIGKRIL